MHVLHLETRPVLLNIADRLLDSRKDNVSVFFLCVCVCRRAGGSVL